ncbi:MAG: 2-oxoglutarate dehydrogenase complex dihydrolipoyllysine-residue succinyltransferase [Bacteroidetes bacterium]|nr:MAG: 2-oxoglutarate dehydrogenase complex dihydrolipoyllysine-residue succinyltransferase [Bacteroidota bacterium]
MIDIRVPEAGESITQVELAKWLAADGDYIEKDQEIAEIDSDKATLTINADGAGILKIIIDEGSTVEPGKVIGQIDTSAEKPQSSEPAGDKDNAAKLQKEEKAGDTDKKQENAASSDAVETASLRPEEKKKTDTTDDFTFSPQASKMLDELNLSIDDITRNPENKRITKKDLLVAIGQLAGKKGNEQQAAPAQESITWKGSREVEKIKMTALRRKIAERLVAVKNDTAMLTTFNEVDMTAVMNLRNKFKDKFQEKYGIKPGFMSFFVKAVTSSIPSFPQVNGQIDDGHIVIHDYADIGIAVSTPKGLMVPVIRDAHSKSLFELEQEIGNLAKKARDNKITIEELTGGTFSITNGGVFGSMLSTPIINPPQSAILGMHNIVDRPVAIDGKVEIRPIMYLALSYDHRIIDGKESVGFLVQVKKFLENPVAMLFQGKDPEEILLGL